MEDFKGMTIEEIKRNSSVKLDKEKCKGCVTCMKRCPTEAIRIRDGKAHILYDKCIACGECVRVCKNRAKRPVFDSFDKIFDYKYKIAMPAPSLYGQFNNLYDVNIVLTALKKLGFDDVAEVSGGAELVSEKTRKLLKNGQLKKPAISSACPAIVELIEMRFHSLSDNLVPILAPVDVTAKMARKKAMEKTGLKPEEIGVFFISPCPAKVFAVRNKLGVKEMLIDGVLAISDLYMRLLPVMKGVEEIEELSTSGIVGIGWATTGGEAAGSLHEKYLAADNMENCISVLRELEDGKMADVDFIELNACPGGCVGGVLNIENPFVAKARMQSLRKYLPVQRSRMVDGVLSDEEMMWEEIPAPIQSMRISSDRMEAMRIFSETENILRSLPGLDCGNCGAPSCRAFAEDVVVKKLSVDMCDKKKK